MKRGWLSAILALLVSTTLGGCVVQYNQPIRKVTPVPLYQPQSAEEVKKSYQQPLLLSQIGCKAPAHWEWVEGRYVCGTPDTFTSYPYWNQPYYGYYPYGYPYMYGRAYYW